MQPTIGLLVNYTLTEGDVAAIDDQIPQSDTPGHLRRNSVRPGETYPALLVRVFDASAATANLQVFLDGAVSYWATSRTEGDGSGHWARPAHGRDQLARTAYAAYGATTNHRNFRGEPMPEWEDLGEQIQDAWRAAARAVADDVAGE